MYKVGMTMRSLGSYRDSTTRESAAAFVGDVDADMDGNGLETTSSDTGETFVGTERAETLQWCH